MAVNVFERVGFGIGYGHEFNHAIFGVAGHAGAFVEIVPAQEIFLDVVRHTAQCGRGAGFCDDGGHIVSAEEMGLDN